jgi:dTDP-4-amino-4,6-dideoxygalactose transaminase
LEISLRAVGIGAGDEVITSPYSFVATAGAIAWVGARPVFVDVEPETFNMDPRLLASALTPKTRAVIPVHLFGCCASMKPILQFAQDNGLWVIEDAAQAIGALYNGVAAGSLGDLGCFSFFPSKNLGGAGDGGMVTGSNRELLDRLRLIRDQGTRQKYHHEILGTNSRLDALQAAILRVKLGRLADWTAKRQEKAARYKELFTGYGLHGQVSLPHAPSGHHHVFNQYVIRCSQRDDLRAFLKARGLPTEIYYPVALHLQPAFSYLGYKQGQFPCAEAASQEALALPVYPELDEGRQAEVARQIAEFYSRQH